MRVARCDVEGRTELSDDIRDALGIETIEFERLYLDVTVPAKALEPALRIAISNLQAR